LTAVAGSAAGGDEEKKVEFPVPKLKPVKERLPAAFNKSSPESVEDLKAIQDHVARVAEKVIPCTVCVRVGASFGSGVIVTKDGYVLTAGHVSGAPGRDVSVIFHDGKTAKGKTLGGNHGIDSGLIKITGEKEWPCLEMGDSAKLKAGEWCIVCAHPGGYKSGRPPVIRLGRLLQSNSSTLTTDCILVGGDSGGPLYDMHGRVVGINSRIGSSLLANMHVPVNPFRDNWEKLAKGEVWGSLKGGGFARRGAYLGVEVDLNADGCIVKSVTADSPAEKAGLKAQDLILKFDGKEVPAGADLSKLVQQQKTGAQVVLEIRRGEETLSLKVQLGKRS
jgi:serine protease Do